MPISLTCSCGKRLKVGDNLAGKKVKCPGCQKAIPVPTGDDESVDDIPTKPARSALSAKPPAPPSKSAPTAKPGAKPGPLDKPGAAAKTKPSAPVKKPLPVDDEDSDLNDLFGDDEPAPKAPVKKKPAKPFDDDDAFEEDKPTPPKKGKKPIMQDEDDDDFGEDDDMPAPKSKKSGPAKKSKKGLLLLILLVVVLLTGGAAGYWYFFMQDPPRLPITKGKLPPTGIVNPLPSPTPSPSVPSPTPSPSTPPSPTPSPTTPVKPPDDKKLPLAADVVDSLPAGIVGFIAVRPSEWWDRKSGKTIQELPQLKEAKIFDLIGISPAEIERFQVSFFPPDLSKGSPLSPAVFAVVKAGGPLDFTKLKALAADAGAKTRMVQSKECWEFTKDSQKLLVYFAGNDLIVGGDEAIMQKYLADKLPFDKESFGAELAELAAKQHLVLAGKIPANLLPPALVKVPPFAAVEEAQALPSLRQVVVAVLDDTELALEVRATFDDENAVKDLQSKVTKRIADAGATLEKYRKDPDLKPVEKKLLTLAETALKDLSLEVVDKTITLKITLSKNTADLELVPLFFELLKSDEKSAKELKEKM